MNTNPQYRDLQTRFGEQIETAVRALQRSPYKAYPWVTGAALGIQNLLWGIKGASAALIGGASTYDEEDTALTLGRRPKSFCSLATAIGMANLSYLRGVRVLRQRQDPHRVIGLGATAAVQTDRERRGDDKIFLAATTPDGIFTVKVILKKAAHSRREQGEICDMLALNLLLSSAGLAQIPMPDDWLLTAEDSNGAYLKATDGGSSVLVPSLLTPEQEILDLLQVTGSVYISPEGEISPVLEGFDPSRQVLFSGSFNPLHHGHQLVADAGQLETGKEVVIEVSTSNAEKKGAELLELASRSLRARGRWPVIISRGNPRFVDKCRAYPVGTEFLMGADTALRTLSLDSRWAPDEADLQGQLREMAERGCRMYVLNRRSAGGVDSLATILEKVRLRDAGTFQLADAVTSGLAGMIDISSTELRQTSA